MIGDPSPYPDEDDDPISDRESHEAARQLLEAGLKLAVRTIGVRETMRVVHEWLPGIGGPEYH